ncbi:plasmid replication protein, CyRepA1 family [Vreelandella zhanjiangensis]|uniref:plasmid replication protein, CyRepA1 family n=1 Tax=Halomonas hibernica TaxID=2591147 RepID=UPI0015545E1A|nr:plasmid replication protein, CyRepA1 family [Halomonas hibernica]
MTQFIDFSAIVEPVALKLLGEPSFKHGSRWRWGSKGSLSVDIQSATWFDHEAGEGGGVLALIERETGLTESRDQLSWLAGRGYIAPLDTASEAPNSDDLAVKRQQREATKAHKEAAQVNQQQAEHTKAAERARWIWGRCKTPGADHPYLILKGIDPNGLELRQHPSNGTLVVPLYDPAGELVNLQFITKDGEKRFLKGARKQGCYTLIGTDNGQGRLFVEGYATGYTVHQATRKQAVVAFDAGNLVPVAANLGRPGDAVAADNDSAVKSSAPFGKPLNTYGTGHKAAMSTRLSFYLAPVPGKDFNDIGIDAARTIFNAAPVSETPVFNPWLLSPVTLPKAAPGELVTEIVGIKDPGKAAAIAYSIAAKLAPRAPAQMPLQVIRAAIEANAEPGALHPATLDAIVDRLDKAQTHRKRRALEQVSLPVDVGQRHAYEPIHGAVPSLTPADYHGVIVVKAPMAAGKTKNIGRPLAEWANANGHTMLAICHRVSLVTELANRLELTHYDDVSASTAYAATGLATCLPSITKPDHASLIDAANIVFIDEVAQVLRFIESEKACSTKYADNQGVYERLREIVAKADCVVVADAGVDRRTIEFLEYCRPGERFRVIEVMPPKDAGITGHYGYGADAVTNAVSEALAELAAGGKPWVAVESIDRAKALEHFFKAAMPGKRIMAIHADNKDNKAQRDFLTDADRESRRYDIVIASPVIGSGLSIEHKPKHDDKGNVIENVPKSEKFTLGVYIGGGHRTTPADAAQQMRRVRYIERFEIALVANSSTVGNQSPEALIAAAVTASRIEGKAAPVTTFDELVASIRTDAENARADFAAGLLWQLETAGWMLERQQNGESEDAPMGIAEVGERLKEARDFIRDTKRDALLNAPIITDERAAELERQRVRSELSNITLEAHRIRRALGIQGKPLDDDILTFWDDGRAVAKLDRFSAFQGVVSDFDDSGKSLSSRRYYEACARAYGWLFEGIDTDVDGWLTLGVANQVLGRVMEHRHLLAHLGIVAKKYAEWIPDRENKHQPRAMKLPAYPVREVVAMMERMGIKMQAKRMRAKSPGCDTFPHNPLGGSTACVTPEGDSKPDKKAKGNPIIRVYQPTAGSLIEMQQWADSRNAARKVISVDTAPRTGTTLETLEREMHESLPDFHRAVVRSLTAARVSEQIVLRPRRLPQTATA